MASGILDNAQHTSRRPVGLPVRGLLRSLGCFALACILSAGPCHAQEEPEETAEVPGPLVEFFKQFGVKFPPGAFASYDGRRGWLVARNTPDNLRRLHMILNEGGWWCQMEISALFMQIPADLAARWGLDGGFPAEPKSTPLGREIGPILCPKEASAVLCGLRNAPGTSILASGHCLNLSGNTAVFRQVSERQLDEVGEARDFGVILEVTPIGAADGVTADLDLRCQLIRLQDALHANKARSAVSSITNETKVLLRDGQTFVLHSALPPPTRWQAEGNTANHAVLAFVTVRFMYQDPTAKAKTYYRVLSEE